MPHICCWLGLLFLIAVNTCNAQVDPNCDFRQVLEVGRQYFITNPNYPNPYTGQRNCRWHAVSTARIRLTCNQFSIPASPNCVGDSFNVYTSPNVGPNRYCGNGDFSRESVGNEMIITLNSLPNTAGGIFRCYIEAIRTEECRCGWKKPTKIVGGQETGINEFPMMAGIINVRMQQVYCGGTIISNTHILTAAHCLNNLTPQDLGVLVGDHDLTTNMETNATKLYRVASFVKHPSYVPSRKDYDIAVITIAGFITYTNEVGPACLPFQHKLDSFGGSFVDVLGWGTMEFAGPISNVLQKARLSVYNYQMCKTYYPELEYRQMCTFYPGRDACQFDSGGPLLWQNPSSRRLVLVGIISYGSACANNKPAVNTRVGGLLDWVVQVTPGNEYCQAE